MTTHGAAREVPYAHNPYPVSPPVSAADAAERAARPVQQVPKGMATLAAQPAGGADKQKKKKKKKKKKDPERELADTREYFANVPEDDMCLIIPVEEDPLTVAELSYLC